MKCIFEFWNLCTAQINLLINIFSEAFKLSLIHVFHQVSALMDKFEQQFEHLDVQSSYMENAMSDTTTLSVPQVKTDLFY